MRVKRKLHALGANIFAGGFTLGVQKHFDVVAQLEHDEYGAEVSALNLKLPIITSQEKWGEYKLRARPDFIYSNPPCAVWSVSGVNRGPKHDNWRLDPRLQRIKDIFELIEVHRPRAWCWESVCQAFSFGREFVNELVGEATRRGYSSTFVFVDARWHGLAQSRKRFFLVCHDVEIDWMPPSYAEHKKSAVQVISSVKPKTVQQTDKWNKQAKRVLKYALPGETLRKAYDRIYGDDYERTERGQARGRFSFHFKRMNEQGPIGAITGPHIVHHKEPRLLSVEELAALCGFPKSFKFPKSYRHDPASRLLARGVMPPVGEWLAKNIAEAIRNNKRVKTPATWYADFRIAPGHVELAATYEQPPAKPGRAQRSPREPRAPRIKAAPIDYDRLITRKPERDAPRTTSGEFIRHHLMVGRHSYEEIAALVRQEFDGRVTTVADIYYQRAKLQEQNAKIPERVRRPLIYKEAS